MLSPREREREREKRLPISWKKSKKGQHPRWPPLKMKGKRERTWERENLQSDPGIKKAFYATNDVPPCHISIDVTIHSCTHKYNSIKHKIFKHLSDLRSSNASHKRRGKRERKANSMAIIKEKQKKPTLPPPQKKKKEK